MLFIDINLFTPYFNSMSYLLVLAAFYRWGNQGLEKLSVVVNCMEQLDWAKGCPKDLVKPYSVCFDWTFLHTANIWINRLNKAECPHLCRWASSDQLKAWIEQKRWPCPWVRENSFSLAAFDLKHQVFLGLQVTLSLCRSWDLPVSIIAWLNSL